MPRKLSKMLFDIITSVEGIEEFVKDKPFEEYKANRMMRLAVEREFEIIGESARRIEINFPDTFASITNGRKIIDFRNLLIHGYDLILDEVVWQTISDDLPILKTEVRTALNKSNE
jgi:uncharacterized protein with HEPN domain